MKNHPLDIPETHAVNTLMVKKSKTPFSTDSYVKNLLNAGRLCDKLHKQKLSAQKTEMKCDGKHVKSMFDTLLHSWLLQLLSVPAVTSPVF